MDPLHNPESSSHGNSDEFRSKSKGECERLSMCEVCKSVSAVYCCPRCSMRTCSLECCKVHKEEFSCDGKRDRTKFVALNQFSDANLLSDYHFLEDVLQNSSRAKRLRTELGASQSHSSHHPKRSNQLLDRSSDDSHLPSPLLAGSNLGKSSIHEESTDKSISKNHTNLDDVQSNNSSLESNLPQGNAAKKQNNSNVPGWLSTHSGIHKKMVSSAKDMMRNVHLLLMPKGMTRHKQNTTRFDGKKDCFFWRVEFIFHIFLPTPQQQNNTTYNQHIQLIVPVDRVSEKSIIGKELSSAMNLSAPLKPYLKQYNIDPQTNDAILFLKRIPCTSKTPCYNQIDKSQALQTVLNGMTVIEYPSIEVLLQKEFQSNFPTIIKEINDSNDLQ